MIKLFWRGYSYVGNIKVLHNESQQLLSIWNVLKLY